MIFTETKLTGAFVLDLEPHGDDRGFFARAFCQREFDVHGLKPVIAQANIVFNRQKARCAACTFSSRRRRKRSSCAAPRRHPGRHRGPAAGIGRPTSATSPWSSPPTIVGALRARAVRARLPGARGRHRDDLPGRRVLHARGGKRPALRRPAPRIGWPLPVTEMSDKDRHWRPLERLSRTSARA